MLRQMKRLPIRVLFLRVRVFLPQLEALELAPLPWPAQVSGRKLSTQETKFVYIGHSQH